MAFLLFAARKIQLKREINSKQYEVALIASKFQEASQAVADKQQAMNDQKNAFNSMTSLFQASLKNQALVQLQNDSRYAQYFQNGQLVADAEGSRAVQMAYQNASTAADAMINATSSIFNGIQDAQNKAELARLQAQASSLETRKTGLETQLKQLEAEYQNYDQALNNSVKEAAPQFGLA